MRFPEEPVTSVYFMAFSQAVIGVFLFLSLIFSITEMTLFCATLLVIGAGTYGWSTISSQGVVCRLEADSTRLFQGQSFTIGIHVINNKFLPALIKVKLGVTKALTGSGRSRELTEQVGLLWYQRLYFSKQFVPERRGVYTLGPPDLRIGDLLGFFPREKQGEGELEVLVYPRIVPLGPLAFPKRELFGTPGVHNPVEDPVLVYGARDYQGGSPAKRILWKASARLDKLKEKLCEPSEQEKVLVLIDVTGFEEAQSADDFERALEVAASLLLDLDRKGFAVGLATNGALAGGGSQILPISKSDHQIGIILELLARLEMTSQGVLHELLSKGYALPWGTSCILFTRDIDHRARRTQVRFKMRNIPFRLIDAKTAARKILADRPGPPPGDQGASL